MIKTSYSKKELALLRVLLSFNKQEVSLDEVCKKYYRSRARPKHPRSSVAATMRHIEWKSHAADEPAISKVTGRGRGEKAVYKVLKGCKRIVDRESQAA